MNIPEEVKIGAHEVLIQRHFDEVSESLGHFDSHRTIISLNATERVTESVAAECFLHELIETIFHFHNVEIEHRIITLISEMLFMVIRDNGLDFRKPTS